eukprot:10855193-Lingulodinium_polyedra.AAC.1
MDNTWAIHGQSMDCPGATRGMPMETPLTIHLSMGHRWAIVDRPRNPWVAHGQYMGKPWRVHGLLIVSPWAFLGLSMGCA